MAKCAVTMMVHYRTDGAVDGKFLEIDSKT